MISDGNHNKLTPKEWALLETVGWIDLILNTIKGRHTPICVTDLEEMTDKERERVFDQVIKIRQRIVATDRTLNLCEGEPQWEKE